MPHKFHATICMIAWRKKDKGDWDAKVQPSSNATNTFKGKKTMKEIQKQTQFPKVPK
jgi:hypothetical protein